MGIYINGLDFYASGQDDEAEPAGACAVEGKLSAMRVMAADFRFIEKLGRTPSLTTMYDREGGERNVIRLATQLERRALAA